MTIVDISFHCQHKEEVNMSKDIVVSGRAWLATARILVTEDEGLKTALWICKGGNKA